MKVYQTTAAYDTAISRWLAAQASDVADTSAKLEISLEKVDDLRYGENPQQKATVYRFAEGCENTASSQFPLVGSEQIQGKPLSYNNYLDADAAWNLVREFDEPACVILKHQNPCGSAVAEDITAAYDRAFACDPKSAFGGIIACNREVPYELVEHFADQNKQFVEVIIAPSYTDEALERMAKRPNLRVLATGGVDHGAQVELRSVDGGMLVQEVDHVTEDPATFTFPTDRKPTDAEMAELEFAWKVCKGVKSNAILVSKGKAGIGMGPGQPNRVDSALLACERAEDFCEREGVEKGGFALRKRRILPVPRQRRRACRAWCDLHHPTRRLQARRREHPGVQRAWHCDGLHGCQAFPPLSSALGQNNLRKRRLLRLEGRLFGIRGRND